MAEPLPEIHSVLVVAHPKLPEAAQDAAQIAAFLQTLGISAAHGLLYDTTLRQRLKEDEFDLLVALGGDGTMLRAGHLCGPCDVPILGINLGHFGFLMEINQEQWPAVLPRLLTGDY